jgi:hypothetical protein
MDDTSMELLSRASFGSSGVKPKSYHDVFSSVHKYNH